MNTVTITENRIDIETEHYTIRVRQNVFPYHSKEAMKKPRLYVGGTDAGYPRPAYTIRGEDPENDKAWDAYNRAELKAMRTAIKGAFAEAGLTVPGTFGFSRKAGCSCGCTAGFVHSEARAEDHISMATFGGSFPARIESIYITAKKAEPVTEPATAEDVEDELEDARLCSCGEVITNGSDQCLGCYVATMKNVEPSQATDDNEPMSDVSLPCPRNQPHLPHSWFFLGHGIKVCPGVKRALDPNAQEISVTLTRGAWNTLRGILGRAERAYESDAESFEAIAQMMEAQGIEPKNSPDNASYSREQAEFARQFGDTFTKAVL